MAVKLFPADFADISADASKIMAAKTDGTNGFLLVNTLARLSSGNLMLAAGKYVGYSENAYFTPEDNTQGARLKTGGGFIMEVAGNVGIGSTTPAFKLDVAGTICSTANGNPTFNLYSTYESDAANRNWQLLSNVDYFGDFDIRHSASHGTTPSISVLKIKSTNGNVGIGTNAPGHKLSVLGNSVGAEPIFIAGKTGFSNGFTVNYNGTSMLYSFLNGNVGIGTNSPGQSLDVIGNIVASGSITPGSDKRLKKNIKTLKENLEKVLELRPVSYNQKSDNDTALGFISDEVQKLFPEVVNVISKEMKISGKNEKNILGINYNGLAAPIVGAIQELAKKFSEMELRLEKLESLLAK